MNIRAELEEKGNKGAEELAEFVKRSPNNLPELVDEMFSHDKRVKNGAAKALRLISEENPEFLLPYLDR